MVEQAERSHSRRGIGEKIGETGARWRTRRITQFYIHALLGENHLADRLPPHNPFINRSLIGANDVFKEELHEAFQRLNKPSYLPREKAKTYRSVLAWSIEECIVEVAKRSQNSDESETLRGVVNKLIRLGIRGTEKIESVVWDVVSENRLRHGLKAARTRRELREVLNAEFVNWVGASAQRERRAVL